MALNILKPERYVALALAALERDTALPNGLISLFDGTNFVGAKGDSVTYKLPGVTKARDYEWRTRTAPIVLDDIFETKLTLRVGTHTYSAVPITDEELTMDLNSFSTEVLLPQTNAIGAKLDGKVLPALAAAPFKVTNLNAAEADDPWKFALKARSALNAQGTPKNNRVLFVGANPEAWILGSQKVLDANSAGIGSQAYRDAVAGRIAGFDVVSSPLLGDNDIYALHPSWGVLSNIRPAAPQGVTYTAAASYKGYAIRVIRDYDPNYLRDRSILSTFTGINSVNDEYDRYKAGDSDIAGHDVGEIRTEVVDGVTQLKFTGKNVRGAKGTFTPAA